MVVIYVDPVMRHMIYQKIRIRVRSDSKRRQKKSRSENLTDHTGNALASRTQAIALDHTCRPERD